MPEIPKTEEEDRSTRAITTLGWLGHVQSLFKDTGKGITFNHGMRYAEEIKYCTWCFDYKRYPRLEILHLTDVQFGHVACREDRFREYLSWVLESPNRYIILGGDMIDAWTIFSPGGHVEQKWGPDSQVYRLCEIMAPVRHRILGSVGGNHERRAQKGFGDTGLMLAQILQYPYSRGQQMIDIHYGDHRPFKFNVWHGRGASRTKGAKAQMLYEFMKQGDAQMYLVGHLHDEVVLSDWRIQRVPGENKVRMVKIKGAMSTSFLEFWGTYAEVAGMTPSDVSMARVILEPNGKWEVTLR